MWKIRPAIKKERSRGHQKHYNSSHGDHEFYGNSNSFLHSLSLTKVSILSS